MPILAIIFSAFLAIFHKEEATGQYNKVYTEFF